MTSSYDCRNAFRSRLCFTPLMSALYERKDWSAPRYDGLEVRITSPGSTSTLVHTSIPCCDDDVICTRSTGTPQRFATASRSSGTPCVAPYWNALLPYLAITSDIVLSISSNGKVSAEGYPPANEYMALRSTFLKISLTGDLKNEPTSSEYSSLYISVI